MATIASRGQAAHGLVRIQKKKPHGKRPPPRLQIMASLGMAAAVVCAAATSYAQGVATDRLSYLPGDTVKITGQGWQPQEQVSLTIGDPSSSGTVVPIEAVAANDGTFSNDSFVPQEADRDKILMISARGSSGMETVLAVRNGLAPGTLNCLPQQADGSQYPLSPLQKITCTIEGATDLSVGQQAGTEPVEVVVKTSDSGNQPATVLSVAGTTISFEYTAPSGISGTASVGYGPVKACDGFGRCTTFATEGNVAGIVNVSGVRSAAGFAFPAMTAAQSPGAARLGVVKSPANAAFTQGSQVSYTLLVTNTAAKGSVSATNVKLTDKLPGNGGLRWETATASQGGCATPIVDNALDCDLGTIEPQGTVTVTVTSADSTPPASCQWQPNLNAFVSADGGLSAYGSGSLTCTAAAQLNLVTTPKSGSFQQGGELGYTMVVSNPAPAGSGPARNVQLKDQLPGNGGLSWVNVSTSAGECALSGNYLACALGDLGAGQYATVTVTSSAATPADACQNQPSGLALATADGGLSASDSGALSCIPSSPAMLNLVVSPKSGTFDMGSQISYTFEVSNPAAVGSAPATNVALTDRLPSNGGLLWQDAVAVTSQGGCGISLDGILDCSLGTIPAGKSVQVTVFSTAVTPVAACQPQPNPAAIATADGGLLVTDGGALNCSSDLTEAGPRGSMILGLLGSAGPQNYAVLSLGGDASHPKAGIYCSNGYVDGNVAVLSYGKLTNMAPCTETGDFYYGAKVSYSGPGKLRGSKILAEQELSVLRNQVIAASETLASMPVTTAAQAQFPKSGSISGNVTVQGSPGVNVVYLPGLTLNGTLTLRGDRAGSQFVLNISGTFDLHKGKILGDGVGSYDVIYNITNPNATVKTMVPTTAIGILLAPKNDIFMDSSYFYGEIIGGYNKTITLISGTRVVPPDVPPSTNHGEEPD